MAPAQAFETDFWKDANLRKSWDEIVPGEPISAGTPWAIAPDDGPRTHFEALYGKGVDPTTLVPWTFVLVELPDAAAAVGWPRRGPRQAER